MKMKKWMIGLMMMTSMTAMAGERGGNGGDAIVCPGTKVRLLDIYEGEQRGLNVSLPGKSVREKVAKVIRKIKTVDYTNAYFIQKYANEILQDLEIYENNSQNSNLKHVFFTNGVLRDIDDSYELFIPANCSKQQLVIQNDLSSSPIVDKRYIIQQDLWNSMNDENKALTVLHESWYRIAIKNGAKDSRFVRLINAYTSSEQFENEGREGYLALINKYSKPMKGNIGLSLFVIQKLVLESKVKSFDKFFVIDQSSFKQESEGFSYNVFKTAFKITGSSQVYYVWPTVSTSFYKGNFLLNLRLKGASFTDDGNLKFISYKLEKREKLNLKNGHIKLKANVEVRDDFKLMTFQSSKASIHLVLDGKKIKNLSSVKVNQITGEVIDYR